MNASASISKSLASSPDKKHLKKLHAVLITSGLHKSQFFVGRLISKYSQFKDPNSCLSIFTVNSVANSIYAWNTIIRAMNHNGLFTKSLELYDEMRSSNLNLDSHTFPSVINACGNLANFDKGKEVHEHLCELSFDSDLFVSNALIDMYSRCNRLAHARHVFDNMPRRDLVSWNSLISGYTSNGYFSDALCAYKQMRWEGFLPDCFSFSSILLACGGLGDVEEGLLIHGLVEKIGTFKDVILGNALLSMYLKFDMPNDLLRVFNGMFSKDAITWNTMICGCLELGFYNEAIGFFKDMVSHFEPDILTVRSVLRACTHVEDFKFGRYAHEYMLGKGYRHDIVSSNIIINMYAKFGDLLRAREVFEDTQSKDLVSWNSLLKGYVEHQLYQDAVNIFTRMKMNLQPDFVSYLTVLSLCSKLAKIYLTKEIHCDIIKQGFDSIQIVGNALIDAYAKCGESEHSIKQFENMKFRDIVTWNSIISAVSCYEKSSYGFELLRGMRIGGVTPDVYTFLNTLPMCSHLMAKRQGKELHGCILRVGLDSNAAIGNALIDMYSNTGCLRSSIQVFERMGTKDIVSWTALINSYGMHGEGMKALEAFESMKADGIQPDHVVFVALICACSHSGLVRQGRALFEQMKNEHDIEPRFEHYACVVDLYSRSGLLAEAEEFINSMPFEPDATIWGSLLSACRAKGDAKIAKRASQHVVGLNKNDAGYHVLASNVYADLEKWDQVETIRTTLKSKGLKKETGFSWSEDSI